jgi:hypothetical protein
MRNGTPRREAKLKAQQATHPEFMEAQAAQLTGALHNQWDSYRVCSFSSIWNSLLLWSHYTDSHQGICLVFDANHGEFGLAFQVQYSDDYPTISYFDRDTDKLFRLMALTKASVWNYENEFRIISQEPWYDPLPPVHNHVYTFPKECLIGVIMGCEISQQNENDVRGWVSGYGPPFKLWRARRARDKYSLDLIPA